MAVCMNIECRCVAPFVHDYRWIGVACLQTHLTSQINHVHFFFVLFEMHFTLTVFNQIELNLYNMNIIIRGS